MVWYSSHNALNLLGVSDKCFRAHSNLPYRWEVKEGLQWTALPDNEGIEREYCDPAKTYRCEWKLALGCHFKWLMILTADVS